MPVNDLFQLRRGTESEWSSANPILASGEPGYDSTNNIFKVGNGITNWLGLNPVNISGSYFNNAVSGLLQVKDILAGSNISVSNSSGIYTITGTTTEVARATSIITTVFNKTGASIPKFKVVYINGGQGDQPTIQLSLASGELSSSKTYGVTYETIDNMGSGRVIVLGALSGVNTDQFNPNAPTGDVNGTTLWLSPSISGGITTTKPYAPYHMVSIGTIVRTHQNDGVVEVKIQNGYELEELHNVAVTGATNGEFLQYNSSSGLWVPSSSGNFNTLQVSGVSVVIGTGTANYLTKWTNTNTVNNSIIYDNGTNIGLGTNSPSYLLDVAGTGSFDVLNVNNQFTFPTGDGSSGQALITDGSGTVVWSGVSPTGHTHTHEDITDFDTAVSGIIDGVSFSTRMIAGSGIELTYYTENDLLTIATTGLGGDGAQGIQGIQGIQGPADGPQGTQGIQGSDGAQGITGSGIQGIQGNDGIQGLQGLQGLQGSGIQGNDGSQGVQGLQGAQGTFGAQGLGGSQGLQGLIGSQGLVGNTGAQGFTGNQGIQGIQGLQGIQGVSGVVGGNLYIAGSVTTSGNLVTPYGGNVGDGYTVNDIGNLFVWTGTAWNDVGQWRGIQGLQGLQGIQGVQGYDGVQGIQGYDGAQGIQGPADGPQGTQGIQGIQGPADGPQGTQGIQGEAIQGIQGTSGSDGSQGTQGIQGPSDGPQGTTGSQGTQGSQGSTGDTGLQGTIGSAGSQGIQGVQGVQGIQGIQGSQGTTGNTGDQGTQGIQGIQGNDGTLGSQGIQGVIGAQGTDGSQGIQGLIGIQGPADGPQGIQGLQGAQGTTGSTGSQGIAGRQGTQGIQGTFGLQGLQGIQGTQGIQGLQGVQGIQGLMGDGVDVVGTVASSGDLNPSYTGNGGDGYITDDTRHLWLWNSSNSTWVDVGEVKGPQGIQGVQGLQGIQGLQGSGIQGIQGYDGAQGIQGIQGVQGIQGLQGSGIQGTQGLQGVQGTLGQGISIVGSVASSGNLNPSYGGLVGDGYIAQDSGDLWLWDGSEWDNVGQVKGPQGTQGIQGIQGLQGIQGIQGIQGMQGLQGVQGGLGPAGGTANQVLFKNASNVVSGTGLFTFESDNRLIVRHDRGFTVAGTNNDLLEIGGNSNELLSSFVAGGRRRSGLFVNIFSNESTANPTCVGIRMRHTIPTGTTKSNTSVGLGIGNFRNTDYAGDGGTISSIFGMNLEFGHTSYDNSLNPTTASAVGIAIRPYRGVGTISSVYSLLIYSAINPAAGTGTFNQYYGIYQQDADAKNYFAGNTGIGTTTPSTILTVNGTITSSKLVLSAPAALTFGTTVTRFYLSTNDGEIKYLNRNELKTILGSTYKYDNDRRAQTTDSSYWTGTMGWGTNDMNSVLDWGSGFIDSWNSPTNSPSGSSHFTGLQSLHYTNGTARYGWQMVLGGGTNNYHVRSVWGGSPSAWFTLLHSGNYTSYSPGLTGTGASGTWSIGISGNAATATVASNINSTKLSTTSLVSDISVLTNIVFSATSYGINFANLSTLKYSGATYGNIEISGTKNGYAGIMYSIGSRYQGWMSNETNVGYFNEAAGAGWRYRVVSGNMYLYSGIYGGGTEYTVLHSNNYNAYSPSLTGTNASGTWNININGIITTTSSCAINHYMTLADTAGFYYANYAAYIRPNYTGLYTPWYIAGTKNAYNGIHFNANNGNSDMILMIDNNGTHHGVFKLGTSGASVGWLWQWSTGNLLVSTNPNGGGALATVVNSTNLNNIIGSATYISIGTTTPPITGTRLLVSGNSTFDGNIVIKRVQESIVANGNTGTSKNIDLTNGSIQTFTLTGNCVFTMPSPSTYTATETNNGRSFTVLLKTGIGGFTASFSGFVKWPGNIAPTITATANKLDIITFISDGTYWYGNVAQNYTVV